METIKLGSKDSRPKKVTIVSFFIQLIWVWDKFHVLHSSILQNTLKVANWLVWLQVNRVLSHIELSQNFLQTLLLLKISQTERKSWSQWFMFMDLWPVLMSILLFQCSLLAMDTSVLFQIWWMKHAHGQPTKTETIFGTKMILWHKSQRMSKNY
jgi:hypothetical protein